MFHVLLIPKVPYKCLFNKNNTMDQQQDRDPLRRLSLPEFKFTLYLISSAKGLEVDTSQYSIV